MSCRYPCECGEDHDDLEVPGGPVRRAVAYAFLMTLGIALWVLGAGERK